MTSPSLDPSHIRLEAAALGSVADPAAEADGRGLRARLLTVLARTLGLPAVPLVQEAHADAVFDALEAALRAHRFFAVAATFCDARRAAALAFFQHKHRFNLTQAAAWPDADLVLLESRLVAQSLPRDYRGLQSTYDERYFLADCGGYAEFLETRGRRLTEVRHHALVALAHLRKGQRILDLGCGRGELAFALARRGGAVIGLDYAPAAIAIARETFADVPPAVLDFVCADALSWTPPHSFDLIAMADVVEHLEAPMLDALLERAASWLAPGGRLLIHTAPNKLAYRSVWRAQRAQALAAGAWLPKNPRSFHEDLMHINEQTPKGLERAMRKRFPHVGVWAADEADPAMTLRVPGGSGWMKAPFLYALASHAPVDRAAALASLSQPALAISPSLAVLRHEKPPAHLAAGEDASIALTLRNDGTEALSSFAPTPVHLASHWFAEDGTVAVWDGERSRLPGRIAPAETFDAIVRITAPRRAGRYTVRLAAVQEFVAWHDEAFSPALAFTIDVG